LLTFILKDIAGPDRMFSSSQYCSYISSDIIGQSGCTYETRVPSKRSKQ